MTALPTPNPDELRHQVQVLAAHAAASHAILNEVEQARRLGRVHTMKPMVQALRDANDAIAGAAAAIARLAGMGATPAADDAGAEA